MTARTIEITLATNRGPIDGWPAFPLDEGLAVHLAPVWDGQAWTHGEFFWVSDRVTGRSIAQARTKRAAIRRAKTRLETKARAEGITPQELLRRARLRHIPPG